MGVDVLTVPDCPNRVLVLERLAEAVIAAGVPDVVVSERVVDDAGEAAVVGMHGSPTVLLNGGDPFAEPGSGPSLSCRLYVTDTGLAGAPTVRELVAALKSAVADTAPTSRAARGGLER